MQMDATQSMGLRLPVQGAVDRTAPYGALAGGTGVEASQLQALIPIATQLAQQYGPDIVKGAWNTISSWF
jgi:hypothetical protein